MYETVNETEPEPKPKEEIECMRKMNESALYEVKEQRAYRSVKISEEDVEKTPKKEEALKKEISRLSFTMASKLPFAKGEQRADITAALSLMTQAMILADDEKLNPEARRHLALARRLAR